MNAARARILVFAVSGLLVLLDLAVKHFAEHVLRGGRAVQFGPLGLHLVSNPGVAFSLGEDLPPAPFSSRPR